MGLTRFIVRMAVFILVPLIAALITFRYLNRSFLVPVDRNNKNIVLVELSPGRTVTNIAEELQAKGALRHWWTLSFLHWAAPKGQKTINAGEYEMTAAMTPQEMLTKLTSGDMFKRRIVVKQGFSLTDVAAAVEEAGLLTGPDFLRGARDKNSLTNANIKGDSFEGYLYPATYFFSRPATVREIIWRMLEEGEKHWPAEFSDQADKLNLSRHEILTLASMIEKESSNAEEQPIISSVFHNRLAKGMKLQCDATVIYGLEDFSGTLTPQDKENDHPYNTYTKYGLPPGPISNPGEIAIRAALFPKETMYLYFAARGDGSHMFSTTYQEHQAAMEQLLKGVLGLGAGVPLMPSPAASPTGHALVTLSPR